MMNLVFLIGGRLYQIRLQPRTGYFSSVHDFMIFKLFSIA